jgi:uncharacterized protein YjbI with pentapeptide repeats
VRCVRIRTMIGIITNMDARCTQARMARRWIGGIMIVAAVGGVASPAYGASPLVRVDNVRISTVAKGARIVSADITWNAAAVGSDNLVEGSVRAVAMSDATHQPTLLGRQRDVDVDAAHPRQRISIPVTSADDVRAMAKGNRVVLTATQHKPVVAAGRTTPTYVTVGQAQPYGSPQPHIGTEDCSDRAVEPGVIDNYCDFVGADFDHAKISWHDPNGSEGRKDSGSSRFQHADFSGATMIGVEISGASVAGGRMNGADLTNGKLDNLSLAGTEAVGLVAVNARSDRDRVDSAANLYDTNLTGADLRRSQFNGVSLERANLAGAKLQNIIWNGIQADGASFVKADLTGAALGPGTALPFANLTDTTLTGTDLSDIQLAWPILCRTKLPKGVTVGADRDCRGAVQADPLPFPTPDQDAPYVAVSDASVTPDGGARTIHAVVTWNAQSMSASGYGMDAGDVRVLAVDKTTGLPTPIATVTIDRDLPRSTVVDVTIDAAAEPAKYAAMRAGNRIVLTATQHAPAPRIGRFTSRSYVTVDTLQKGPGRGRVGMYDCSRVALTQGPAPVVQDFCDLTGATLTHAQLDGSRFMRDVDLTGAQLGQGMWTAITLDGSWLPGVDAQGATWNNLMLFAATAPALNLSGGRLSGSRLRAADLTGFAIVGGWMGDSTLAGAPMNGADFTGAQLNHPDLAYTRLRGAHFDRVTAVNHPSLFGADLTSASLADSSWDIDESGELPWTWATLCHTTMPPGVAGGDRDCPR